MTRRTTPTLPTPTWGGLSQREHAIKQAREWQAAELAAHPPSNWAPTATYLVVRDLLIALEDAPQTRVKRGAKR